MGKKRTIVTIAFVREERWRMGENREMGRRVNAGTPE
jgi:hypothetical protein